MKKILSLLFFILIVPAAQATLVRSANIRELVQDSQYIVKATVTAKDTVVDTDESGHIVTYYTVTVSDWIKGTPNDDNQMVFKQIAQGEYTLNGERIRQNLFFPQYEVGKTYVLFLPEAHSRTGLLAPVGLQQGVFDVILQNGQEVLPQLKNRTRLLETGLSGKQNRFLKFQIRAAGDNSSYQGFKDMIEAAGQK